MPILLRKNLGDDRRGGWKILGLLKEVSKPCHPKGETKKMACCLGSKGKCPILSKSCGLRPTIMCYQIKVVKQHGAGHEIESMYRTMLHNVDILLLLTRILYRELLKSSHTAILELSQC